MKKRVRTRELSRKASPRRALLNSLARSIILKERIQTTEAKAKEASRYTEKLITCAKKGGLASQRTLLAVLDAPVVKKMTGELAERYRERNGGYTRVVKKGPRKTDGARMAIVELVK